MSGYVTVYGTCFACRRPFFFNPRSVPSHQGEPICQGCITLVNERRRATGLPLWPVAADAYEPLPEGELPTYGDYGD